MAYKFASRWYRRAILPKGELDMGVPWGGAFSCKDEVRPLKPIAQHHGHSTCCSVVSNRARTMKREKPRLPAMGSIRSEKRAEIGGCYGESDARRLGTETAHSATSPRRNPRHDCETPCPRSSTVLPMEGADASK